jgi:membrane-bound lytic murein transglycosylase B
MKMQPACPRITKMIHPPQHSLFSFPARVDVADCRAVGRQTRKLCPTMCLVAALSMLAGNTVHAEPISNRVAQVASDSLAANVTEASQRSGIPASWISAVMQAESGGDARAVSPKGAMGLMQIMPETWATLRLRYGLGADPFDPHDNIIAGAAYLRELHDRYGSPGFLAAYNAGPTRYENHVATGQPLPAETRAYLALLAPMVNGDVISDAAVLPVVARSWTEAPLFTVRANDHSATDQRAAEQHADHHATDTAVQDLTALAPQSNGLFVQTTHRSPRP